LLRTQAHRSDYLLTKQVRFTALRIENIKANEENLISDTSCLRTFLLERFDKKLSFPFEVSMNAHFSDVFDTSLISNQQYMIVL
jgi:hypothetical protein